VPKNMLVHFTKNANCASAYAAYMCYMNFPRCDAAGTSLNLCKSACENFFKACDYPRDLWRCGSFELFGGDAPEVSKVFDATTGAPLFLRAWFPGSPFTANAMGPAGPLPVCTPGTASAAPPRAAAAAAAVVAAAVLAAALAAGG